MDARLAAGLHEARSHTGRQTDAHPAVAGAGPALMLVDGHHLLYRAHFGFPRRVTTASGEDLTGLFGFVALLRKAHREHCPDHEVVVVFDAEDGSAGRAENVPGYKAGRAGADHSPVVHLPAAKLALDTAGVRWLEQPGCEGDDALATLARIAADTGRAVVVFSGDRDLYGLLDGQRVRILNTQLPAGRQLVTAADVATRFGVLPVQWPDFRALTGDASDGIPGVAGVGPVTAGQLLADGRHLEDLPETATGRAGTGLARARAQWPEVVAWREALRLNARVPVPDGLLTDRATPELLPAGRLLTEAGLW
ncbi:flap endonuclease [Streptomyces bambusae]|uniref:5'-3' exonuclease n=2 Tax=Streptomyces bambusae TaxID=1550616 RepID=A0ABS6YZ82_9ACTN|nr:flap endonuclease [Streptomyces bambusae]